MQAAVPRAAGGGLRSDGGHAHSWRAAQLAIGFQR